MAEPTRELATAVPTRKVIATAITGGVVTILVWVLRISVKLEVPADVAVAFTTIIGFAVAYMTESHPRDLKAKAVA